MKKHFFALTIVLGIVSSYLIIGCQHVIPVDCNQLNFTLNVTQTDVTTSSPNGTITATATGGSGFLFSLDGGPQVSDGNFTSLAAGTYILTGTNSNGCSASDTIIILNNYNTCNGVNITVSTTPNNPTNGLSNGSITATASPADSYTYSINGGSFQSSSSFINLPAGSYSITAKNSNGCTGASATVILTSVNSNCPTIVVSGTGNTASTICATDGTITATATGGATPYTFSKDGTTFQSSGTFSTLAAGTYTITAKDVNGCLGTKTITVSGPATVSFLNNIKPTINSYCGSSNISCHSHNNAWTTYSDIVGSSSGTAWSGNLSTFLGRIRSTSGSANSQCPLVKSSGNHNMPPTSSTAWTNFVRGALTNWIDQGYPNN